MRTKTRVARTMTLACTVALAGCISAPGVPQMAGAVTMPDGIATTTVPFTFDDNRMFLPLMFVTPDGRERKAMAFVNQGSTGPVLSPALYRELGIGDGHALTMHIGQQRISVAAATVQTPGQSSNFRILLTPFAGPMKPEKETPPDQDMMAQLSGPLHVEAILPSGVLQNFDVAFDYGARTLTLAPPGTLPHDGIAVPYRGNPQTGFVTVDLTVAGKKHPAVIDNGGSYSVGRASMIADIAAAHPGWVASDTTVGEANTTGSPQDVGSPVLKLPNASLGAVPLQEMGLSAIGSGTMLGRFIGGYFWDFYSRKAGEPVDLWLGGNVLKDFRITFDAAHCVSYWQRERETDAHELDQVGITLMRVPTGYVIGAVANKNGKPTVTSVQVGDGLIAVDGLTLLSATRGQIFTGLHGTPGERRRLLIERNGKRLTVDATVTAF